MIAILNSIASPHRALAALGGGWVERNKKKVIITGVTMDFTFLQYSILFALPPTTRRLLRHDWVIGR